MNKNIIFGDTAWEDYTEWLKEDKKVLKKINDLIDNISRTPFEGLGKPEPLKNELSGYWSRRITEKHRLIYKLYEDKLYIIGCKEHYDN